MAGDIVYAAEGTHAVEMPDGSIEIRRGSEDGSYARIHGICFMSPGILMPPDMNDPIQRIIAESRERYPDLDED